jgi:predicted dehydrogenase
MDVKVSTSFYPKGNTINSKAYRSLIKMSNEPGCAIIAVPDHLHTNIARDCLNNNLATLVVKPLATNINDAKELIKIQKEKKIYGATEFHKRYDRQNLKIKEALNNGEIGDPLYFIVEYSQRKNIPFKTFSKWVDKTNVFQYLGVHYVDIIYFVTGAIPKRIRAQGQTGWLKQQGLNTYDTIHTIIEWELRKDKIFLSFIHTNWIDPVNTSAMSDQRIKVIGTKGRIEADQKNRGLQKITDSFGIEDINPDFCNTYPMPDGNISYQGYGIESINTFLNDVQNLYDGNIIPKDLEGKRPTFSDSLISVAVVEAANVSLAKQGSWVDITI